MINKWIAAFGACLLAIQLTGCSDSAVKADPAVSDFPEAVAAASDKPSAPPAYDPSIAAVVNKQHSLDETYVPDDLVTVDVPTVLNNPEVNQLRREAADALKEMFDKAAESGITENSKKVQ